jgi:hypothetical protein
MKQWHLFAFLVIFVSLRCDGFMRISPPIRPFITQRLHSFANHNDDSYLEYEYEYYDEPSDFDMVKLFFEFFNLTFVWRLRLTVV